MVDKHHGEVLSWDGNNENVLYEPLAVPVATGGNKNQHAS